MSKHTFKGQTVDIESMTAAELLPIFNEARKAMKMEPIGRFSDTKTARRRTAELLDQIAATARRDEGSKATKPAAEKAVKAVEPKAAKATKPAGEKAVRAARGTNLLPPGGAPLACREGSKQAMLVDLLSKESGATMSELLRGLSGGNRPWTEASVRSGFGWDLKQKGYGVHSVFVDGVEVFHLVVPKGYAIPAHIPLKGKAKADARQTRLSV